MTQYTDTLAAVVAFRTERDAWHAYVQARSAAHAWHCRRNHACDFAADCVAPDIRGEFLYAVIGRAAA